MSKALKSICGMDESSIIDLRTFTKEQCQGVDVVKQHLLYPLGWFETETFFSEKKTRSQWEAIYNASLTIHLFNSVEQGRRVVLKPRFYGVEVPALLYLAERFCPLSFESVQRF